MFSYKLHRGLIVNIGGISFELMSDCEAVCTADAIDLVETGALTMQERLHISEQNKLSSIVDDYAQAGGKLPLTH